MYIMVTKDDVKVVSPSQPVYYKLVLKLKIVPRNVHQDSQRAMLIYCHAVNLHTINWY